MAINFNALPSDKPAGFVIPKGQYKAVVEKAEMKKPKGEVVKPDYLNLQFALSDLQTGAPVGKLYDILSESDSEYVMYKIGRFMKALNINLGMSFELKDLAKIVANKTLVVDVTVDEKSEPKRNQVDIFSGGIYYSLEEILNPAAAAQTDSFEGTPFGTDNTEAPQSAPTTEY